MPRLSVSSSLPVYFAIVSVKNCVKNGSLRNRKLIAVSHAPIMPI